MRKAFLEKVLETGHYVTKTHVYRLIGNGIYRCPILEHGKLGDFHRVADAPRKKTNILTNALQDDDGVV